MSTVAEQIYDTKAVYNSIAEEYAKYDTEPLQTAVEEYTLFNTVIEPTDSDRINKSNNSRILDLACGTGYCTRKMKERYPNSYVCGLDYSSSMINQARTIEAKLQQGIDYICADGKASVIDSELPLEQQYDIITSVYYLNHAQTQDELHKMIQGIFIRLKPGGIFCSINGNVCNSLDCYNNEKHKKYFFSCEIAENALRDGMPIKLTFYSKVDGSPSLSFHCFHMSPVVYEKLFKECGFSSFEWIQPQCDPNYSDPSYFDDFLRYPTTIGIKARK